MAAMVRLPSAGSSMGRVERNVLRDLALPAVAVREQALLVVVELLWGPLDIERCRI